MVRYVAKRSCAILFAFSVYAITVETRHAMTKVVAFLLIPLTTWVFYKIR